MYFVENLHRCPWRSGSDGGLSILRMWVHIQIIASFFFFFFFSLLLLQWDFNINLIPYSVSPTFFTPYDAQASSALSALIKTSELHRFNVNLPLNLCKAHLQKSGNSEITCSMLIPDMQDIFLPLNSKAFPVNSVA